MAEDGEDEECQQGEAGTARRGVLVSACRRDQRCLHSERHGMREAGAAHTVYQHARGGDGGPRVRRTPSDLADAAQHLRPAAGGSTQSHSRRRDGQSCSQGQHHHLVNALRRTQVL